MWGIYYYWCVTGPTSNGTGRKAKIAINIVINYEEGSEVTPVNGDDTTEVLASEMGPGVKPMVGMRNVNMESLYEVSEGWLQCTAC